MTTGFAKDPAVAQTPRILVIGDSWGQFSNPVWPGQFNGNGWGGVWSHVNIAVGGTTAAQWAQPDFGGAVGTNYIDAAIAANPTIDVVHISLGGNDFLQAPWTANLHRNDPAGEQTFFANIAANLDTVVNHIRTNHPQVQAVVTSYDYLAVLDGVSQFKPASTAVWLALGQPNATELNVALFGDQNTPYFGTRLGLEDHKAGTSIGRSGAHYASVEGFAHFFHGFHAFFPPGVFVGHLDFPSPMPQAFGDDDAIHYTQQMYNVWVDHYFNTFYNNLLDNNVNFSASTANGGTLDAGFVLVGQSDNVTDTVQNTDVAGSRLDVAYGPATGEFSGGGGPTDYLFVEETSGAGDANGETFNYSPTNRGVDSQVVSRTITENQFTPNNQSITLRGQGVAPVNDVDDSAADAGLARIGTTGTAQVTITNVGDGNLSGLGAASNLNGTPDAGTGEFAGGGNPFSLGDGLGEVVTYNYTPTDRGADSLAINIVLGNGSADGTNSAENVGVTLQGQGVGPDFASSIAPGGTVDFGDVFTGSIPLDVQNASVDPNGGDSSLTDLTLLGFNITGPDASMFSLTGLTPGTVLSQSELANLAVEFLFGGGPLGLKLATLELLTDQNAPFGASGATFTYNLQANVIPEPASLLLCGLGAALFALRHRQKRVALKRSSTHNAGDAARSASAANCAEKCGRISE